ncbi:MAG: NAD(P)/FAD-dependent oxidoreductase, partial [Desulfofustis sp.]|nr:NAD(P)/FAD-dependent oxidoreductase [Desulfofustis sp.]
HLANYDLWREAATEPERYRRLKESSVEQSQQQAETLIGPFADLILFHDSFSPLTIERYTGKQEGAIYGSPVKIKDGLIGYENLILAGTDQGYLGIIGALLSGVSMVNNHLLINHQPSPTRED